MPLSVVIHLSTQLAVPPRILTRHVVHGVGGARLYAPLLPLLDRRHEPVALLRIGGREEQRLAAGGGERIAQRGEDHDEEDEDEGEERGGDKVQEPPLTWVTL